MYLLLPSLKQTNEIHLYNIFQCLKMEYPDIYYQIKTKT
jgi:hypothetical protein